MLQPWLLRVGLFHRNADSLAKAAQLANKSHTFREVLRQKRAQDDNRQIFRSASA